MTFCVNDWRYAGEGKMRIALSNVSGDSASFGKLLLLQKISHTHDSSAEKDARFIDSVMRHWFSENYISDLMDFITIDDSTAYELLNMVNRCRPLSRIQELNLVTLGQKVTVQRNFSLLSRQLPDSLRHYEDELSFELKVKCGLKSVSSFVCDTAASLKLDMSRFHLMQLYKQANKSSVVGWGEFSAASTYDPSQMFTKDPCQIKSAITTLVSNPQNNLRISLNAVHMYGWEKNNMCHMDQAIKLSDFRSTSQRNEVGYLEEAVDVVAAILAEESLLAQMESMQRLDLLDSEGAAVVYARLIEISASAQIALCLFEEQLLRPLDRRIRTWNEKESNSVDDECITIARQLANLSVFANTAEDEKALRLQQARDVVGRASAQQCLFLLQMWMLSIIAKDASIVVTFRRVRLAALDAAGKRVCNMCVTAQTPTHCGTVVCLSPQEQPNDGSYAGYAYTVGVIDIGMKSLDKAWKKAKEDDHVCRKVWEHLYGSRYENII